MTASESLGGVSGAEGTDGTSHVGGPPGERGVDLAFGRFELVRALGAGGTATVWEARDRVTGERVALKLLRAELTRSTVDRQAFLAEARFVARVQHPGVVRIIDCGEQQRPGLPPQAWVAMEVIEGRTLSRHVRESGPLSVDDALVLTEALLDALDAVHRSGIVHRDVTPANVMVSIAPGQPLDPAQVRLFDFGLAGPPGTPASASFAAGAGATLARSSRSEQADQPARTDVPAFIWGSAPYLSPEQASGSPVQQGADLYQAGGVLTFALTGRAPFEGQSAEELMLAHVNDPVDPPSVHRPEIPERVDRLVLRALRKSPHERFASAQEMRWAVRDTRIALSENEVVTARLVPVLGAGPGAFAASAAGVPGGRATDARAGSRSKSAARFVMLAGSAVVLVALTVGGLVAMIGGRDAPRVEATSTEPPRQAVAAVDPTPTATTPRLVAVPDLVGRSLAEARDLLEAAGLTVGEITTSNGASPADTVLSMANPAGARVAPGTSIPLTIASGWNAVPNLTGLTEAEAQQALAAAGLSGAASRSGQGGVTPPAHSASPLVTATLPAAGTVVRLGAQVTFTLGSQVPGPTPAPTDPTDPTDPADPTDPTDPTDPIDPTDPTPPVTPGGSGNPTA